MGLGHDANFGQLPLFSDGAYRYFLPAYLLRCLDDFDPGHDVCVFVIYSLTPAHTGESMRSWYGERVSAFEPRQRAAVAAFLEAVLASDEFREFRYEAADGLRRYWGPPAENAT